MFFNAVVFATALVSAVVVGHMAYADIRDADEAALARAMDTVDVPVLVPEGGESHPYWRSRILLKKTADYVGDKAHDGDAAAWNQINAWIDEIVAIREEHPDLKEDSEYRWAQRKLERAILFSDMRSFGSCSE